MSATEATAGAEILFILYPGMTHLDFAGPYEVFARLPGAGVRLASPSGGDVRTELGLTLRGTQRLGDIVCCDLLCIPGGFDQAPVLKPECLKHVRRLAKGARFVTSVCTGSLVLAAAGLLQGRRSACHWARREALSAYGAIPEPARIVRDGKFITAAGVTAGVDFALVCAAELASRTTAQAIQLLLEYAPEPPFACGRPEEASPEILAECHRLASAFRGRLESASRPSK
jgi:transcriptional regulator GlxA family with amidase domain